MFKYLLLQSVETTAYVFSKFDSETKGPDVQRCKMAIRTYNTEAKQVWLQKDLNFTRRRHQCSAIYDQMFLGLRRSIEVGDFQPVPKEAPERLDAIFKAHYRSLSDYTLFGRLDEETQLVNRAYALQVTNALREIDRRYGARAILCLSPLYGRGAALPLMTEASVDAMWEVCQSYYYNAQLNAVSSTPVVLKQIPIPLPALYVD